MQPTIAYIAGQLILGGAEQQLYYLLARLDRAKYRPIVIHLGSTPDEYWARPITELGIPVQHLPRSLGRSRRAYRIAELLRDERTDIVHGWMFHTNPYAAVAGRLSNVPVRLGSMREHYEGLPPQKWLRWIGFRGLDALITNSTQTTLQVEKLGVTKARVFTVANGVAIPQFVSSTDRRELKKSLGFATTDILIGSIGRLDKNKNYSMLLTAFAPLARECSNLQLVIIGDGPMRSELLELGKNLISESRYIFLARFRRLRAFFLEWRCVV